MLSIKIKASLFILYSLFICNTSLAQNVKMTTVDWEPFYSSKLESGGVVSAIVKAAFEKAGHSASISWYPWHRAIKAVEFGSADAVMGAYYSKDREKTFYYSDPFFSIDVGLIALKSLGITKYKSMRSLAPPYSISAVNGWHYSEEFDSAKYLNKQLAINQVLATKMLFAKRVDMVAASIEVFKHEVNNMPKHNLDETVVLSPLLDSKPLYLMFSKKKANHKILASDFNRGLRGIQKDGTFKKIVEKYGF